MTNDHLPRRPWPASIMPRPFTTPPPTTTTAVAADPITDAHVTRDVRDGVLPGVPRALFDPRNLTILRRRTYTARGRKHAEQLDLRINCPRRPGRIQDDLEFLGRFFTELVAYIKKTYRPNELCKIVLTSAKIHKAIFSPLNRVEYLRPADITDHIAHIVQSSESLLMSDLNNITIGIVTPLEVAGAARYLAPNTNMFGHNFLKLKKSCVIISNTDTLCLPRAICVSWASAHKFPTGSDSFRHARSQATGPHKALDAICFDIGCVSEAFYSNLRRANSVVQKKMAIALCNRAGIDLAQPLTLADLRAFEDALLCDIRVISQKAGDVLLPRELRYPYAKSLYVYLTDSDGSGKSHVDSVVSMSGFLNPKELCRLCHTPHPVSDACTDHCHVCLTPGCGMEAEPVTCTACNVICNSATCFDAHR